MIVINKLKLAQKVVRLVLQQVKKKLLWMIFKIIQHQFQHLKDIILNLKQELPLQTINYLKWIQKKSLNILKKKLSKRFIRRKTLI